LLEFPYPITETGIENTIEPVPLYPIVIEKNGKVLEKLNNFLEAGRKISPTALDQYLQCSLSYYFKYIARLEEEEEVSEEVDARMFGTLFHSVMDTLYRDFLNKTIHANDLKSLAEDELKIERELKRAFSLIFFKSDGEDENLSLAGRNILVYEVIRKMVIQTIRVDIKRTPFILKGLEQKADATLAIYNGTKAVRIGGTIDRIDSVSGATEIIDYKTGATEHSFKNLAELFDPNVKKRNKAAFQTLLYAFVWDVMHPGEEAIYPCIYALKEIFKQETSRLTIRENGNREVNYPELKDQFKLFLVGLLEEIFNPDLPFTQTTVEEHCQYCTFISICGK